MIDIWLETTRAIVVFILFIYLWRVGIKQDIQSQKGWSFIVSGFGLVLFGMLIDITDNFHSLNKYVIIGDTDAQAFLEKVLGYLIGFLLINIGFWKWMPTVVYLKKAKLDLQKSQEQLENQKERLVEAQNIANLGHWEFDIVEDRLIWSDQIYRIFGLQPHEFVATFEAFGELVHPDDRDFVNTSYTDCVKTHKPYDIQHRIITTKGSEKWVRQLCTTIYNEVGKPIRSLGIIHDITSRKEQEEVQLRVSRQQEELKRLGSLKTMAGAIAHRFNNAMMIVWNNLDLTLETLPEDSDEYEMISDALQAARGATQVGKMMLSYVGQQPLVLQDISLDKLVRESVTSLKSLLQPSISLQFAPPDRPLYCSVDQKQIKEVIVNIITNAIESLNDGSGTIEITFGVDYFTADSFPISFQNDNIQNGMYTFCQIKDSGHGIKPKDLSRIFEPFYTTRFVGRGLGLALTVGIMQSLHGALTVESQQDKGTTVRILLPSISSPQQIFSSDDVQSDALQLSGDILLADD